MAVESSLSFSFKLYFPFDLEKLVEPVRSVLLTWCVDTGVNYFVQPSHEDILIAKSHSLKPAANRVSRELAALATLSGVSKLRSFRAGIRNLFHSTTRYRELSRSVHTILSTISSKVIFASNLL